MPYGLPEGFNPNETWEPQGEYVEVAEDIYLANIFAVENKKDSKGNPYYAITFRLQGGSFDGEDVKATYVGLMPTTIFRLYDILNALGIVDNYYNAETKQWFAIPTADELQGGQLYVKVDDEFYHAQDKDTKEYRYNDDGSARIYASQRPTRYFSAQEDKPEYRPVSHTVKVAGGAAVPFTRGGVVFPNGAAQGEASWGAPVATPGAAPQGNPVNGSDTAPW